MFTVPKVVALSPQQRLLEDDLSVVSLADVFKQVCPPVAIICTRSNHSLSLSLSLSFIVSSIVMGVAWSGTLF